MMPTLNETKITESFYIDNRGFLYFKLSGEQENYVFTIEKLVEYIDTIAKTCDDKINTLLIDVRELYGGIYIQKACYRLLVKDIKLNTVCKQAAFITNSPSLTSKVENFINTYKPKVNTKVFNCLETAIDNCLTT